VQVLVGDVHDLRQSCHHGADIDSIGDTSDMKLEGRVAAITGGTRGLGRGMAEAFLAEGAKVVVNGRTAEKGAATLAEIGAGDALHFHAGDITKQENAEGLIDEAISHFGQLDILVNNAGGLNVPASIIDMPDEEWLFALDWNVNAPFWATRRALPGMVERGWGRVINISSMFGKMASPSVSQYVTTKHALNGFTKAVSVEYGAQGVTCNSICPGLVITDIVKDNGPDTAATLDMSFDEYVDMIVAPSAIKRPNTVEEVAAMAVLLASDVGGGITGTMMSVDGGASPY
jgi:3-hydroxybutyrate dehydrogenase